MSKHYYIGLATSSHDPSIAIIDDEGRVLFAEGAERHYQVKRAIGFPPDNIAWAEEIIEKYCIPGSDYTITKSWSNAKVYNVALKYSSGLIHFNLNKHIKRVLMRSVSLLSPEFNDLVLAFKNFHAINITAGASIERTVRNRLRAGNIKVIGYDHHISHAGLACYGSPFSEAVCLVADGEGEGGGFCIYNYKNGKITLLQKQKNTGSLGRFYASITSLCGFSTMKGEEWKVMGLAAYGSFNEKLYTALRAPYYVKDCTFRYRGFDIGQILSTIQLIAGTKLEDFSFEFKADIAYNGQLAYSQWMNELLTNIHKKYPSNNLILTGGCALNSSYNGEILNKTPFKNLYVPSAPADDGCGLGGALLAYYADHPQTESIHKNLSPYLGSEIDEGQLQHFLKFSGQKVRKLQSDKYETVARLLADGKIIGWVQGKAEYGPRSLGNRSILTTPRKKEIKDIINEKVKFREEFRPFAPSILHEYGPEYFEHYQESHYMERTLKFKQEAIAKVPGVVHMNNTGRLQTIKEEWNPEMYHLIKAFYDITGVPVLLNTSFNVMGKPIIHSLEDALSTFFTTGIDALVINDYLIEK